MKRNRKRDASENVNTNPPPAGPPPVIQIRPMSEVGGMIGFPPGHKIDPIRPDEPDDATPPPEADAQPPPKPRADQFQCPKCHRHGCPAAGGTKRRPAGITRYRQCSHCGWVFQTFQPPAPSGFDERLA
jgi:DNA-directed RNA polymerase subunit M/transcription elongation factor TFIIS